MKSLEIQPENSHQCNVEGIVNRPAIIDLFSMEF